ncbi:bacteriorhodopsin [Halosimplex aquaticum]|uniref:Bacteriorhodopsin n=1 Tax=Halosimplex aquaticum TaxID=3026162 RepID=A0ABD5Y8K0_9EURY|nr:bacteriorhodopsin [Halosimplex aquaticum]
MLGLTTWFTIGALGMVVGTVLLAYGLTLVPTERRRQLALAAVVPAIAAVAYGLMALGFGGLTTADGATVFVPRYVDWLLTTPIHVAVIALVVGASTRLIARLATLQALTIVFGFVGATLASPLNWALYLVGSACFAGVVYLLFTDCEALADESADDVAALFRKLRSFVVVLWLIYPVIWLLAPPGVGAMDTETTALVVTYIDVVAKVGFGLIVINDFASMAAANDEVADVDASIGDGPDAAD